MFTALHVPAPGIRRLLAVAETGVSSRHHHRPGNCWRMALLGLMGLILFLLGKYSSGLARLQGPKKPLRPGAAYMLLSAYVCFAVTATIAAFLAGFG